MLLAAQECFKHLPWDVSVALERNYSTSDLAHFLSDRWLATRHVDWMLDILKTRLPRDELLYVNGPDWIESLSRVFECRDPSEAEKARFGKIMRPEQLVDGKKPKLYFAVNYGNVHWLAMGVDFERQEIYYGDSMGGSRSSARYRNVINAWVTKTWGYSRFVSKSLPVANQGLDSSSCGICAINTIESQLLSEPLWVEELAAAYRASKFLEIAHHKMSRTPNYSVIPPIAYIGEELTKSAAEGQNKNTLVLEGSKSTNKVANSGGLVEGAPSSAHTQLTEHPKATSQKSITSFFKFHSSVDGLSTAAKRLRLASGQWVENPPQQNPSLSKGTPSPKSTRTSSPISLDCDLAATTIQSHTLSEHEGSTGKLESKNSQHIDRFSSPEPALPSRVSTPDYSDHSFIPQNPKSVASSTFTGPSEGYLSDDGNTSSPLAASSKLSLCSSDLGSESQASEISDGSAPKPAKKRNKPGKSWANTLKKRRGFAQGTQEIDTKRWETYVQHVKDLDPHAYIDIKNPYYIRHSSCGKELKMREIGDLKNFKIHVNRGNCTELKPGASKIGQNRKLQATYGAKMKPIFSFMGFSSNNAKKSADSNVPDSEIPNPSSTTSRVPNPACPGLSEGNAPGVEGYIHLHRWMNSTNDPINLVGNAANAKQAADRRATSCIQARRTHLRDAGLGLAGILEDISTGRITVNCPIATNSYIWAIINDTVCLARVLAIYTRTSGPNGMHLWVPQTSQLGLISQVVLQVYQKMPNARAKFRETHYGKLLELKNFQLVPAHSLMAMLPRPSELVVTKQGGFLELVKPNHIEDMGKMTKYLPQFSRGMEAMSKAQRSGASSN